MHGHRRGPSVESLITPDRLIQFGTGRADEEGTIYGEREQAECLGVVRKSEISVMTSIFDS